MKGHKIFAICLSGLLICLVGCSNTEPTMTSSVNSEPVSSELKNNSSEKASSEELEPVSSTVKEVTKAESKKPQNGSEWIVYSNSKDSYKLHKKKKDGSEDKIILNESVVAPCLANGWVYYFPDLGEIDKVKLDGSEKTKVCDTVTMDALNANSAITPEYKQDGYILYKLVQLREIGDDRPNTVTYYKLDLSKNMIIPINN